jgi:hypothetical protein
MNSGITFDLRAERGPYAFENRHRLESVGAEEGGAVGLACGLAGAVRRQRRHRLVLGGRVGVVAERRIAGRENEPADAGLLGGPQRQQRAACVQVEVLDRVLDRVHDPRSRSQVEHRIDPVARALQRLEIADVAHHQLDVQSLEVLTGAAGEVVVHAHRVAALQQQAGKRGADEPGSAGDDRGRHRGRLDD